MDHPAECEAGQFLKLIQAVAAVDPADGFIGVEQFFVIRRFIDIEAAGHLFTKLFDHRKALFI